MEEFMLAMKACVRTKGYDWEFLLEGGGFSITGMSGLNAPLEQQQREKADLNACYLEVDPARLQPPVLTDTQLKGMYRYALAQSACMREAGYPAGDPPPFDVFADSGGLWDPYGDLARSRIAFSHEDLIRCQNVPERPSFMDR